MSTQTVTPVETTLEPAPSFMPVMRPHEALERYQAFKDFVEDVLRPGVDFGVIPGTTKPTLLKPGAEKLATFFGLSVHFEPVQVIEDWTGEEHGGEPLFYYWYRCELTRDGRAVADAEASCNSREKKYRWRDSQRKCPSCGQPAIIKGRPEYGGGWVCFAKKGGCGAKFRDDDTAITGQQTGRAANEDIADAVNTIQKMAQKRALVAATLIGTNASEYFTQDIEDYIDADFTPGPAERVEPLEKFTKGAKGAARAQEPASAKAGETTLSAKAAEPARSAEASGPDAKRVMSRMVEAPAVGGAVAQKEAAATGTPAQAAAAEHGAAPRASEPGGTKGTGGRAEKPKGTAETRAPYAPAAGNASAKQSASKEVEKLAAFFASDSAPAKTTAGASAESGAPSLDEAMTAWKAAWAQANKAGVRGPQYFASPSDTLSAIVEKTALLRDAIKAKQGSSAGR